MTHQRQKLAWTVWFSEVVVGAGRRRLFPVTAQRERRDHDDRDVARARVRFQYSRCIEARHFWQLHIHEDEIRQLLLRLGDAGFAVDGFDQPVRSAAHQLPHDFSVVLVVFDVKNSVLAHWCTPTLAASLANAAAALPPKWGVFAPWDGPAALMRCQLS